MGLNDMNRSDNEWESAFERGSQGEQLPDTSELSDLRNNYHARVEGVMGPGF